jgi:hypothetical protein
MKCTRFFFRQIGPCVRSEEAFFFKAVEQAVAKSSEGTVFLRLCIVCEDAGSGTVLVMLTDCTYSQIGGSDAVLECRQQLEIAVLKVLTLFDHCLMFHDKIWRGQAVLQLALQRRGRV